VNSGAMPPGEAHQLLNELTDLLIAHLWDPLPLTIRQEHPFPQIDKITQEQLMEAKARQWTWEETPAERLVSSVELPGICLANVDNASMGVSVVDKRDMQKIHVLNHNVSKSEK